jgi:hypothetical protein
MKTNKVLTVLWLLITLASAGVLPVSAQDKTPAATTPVHMTVKVRLLDENKRMPDVNQEDVVVTQSKSRLDVTGWTPAVAHRTGLELFILIDDASHSSVATQFDELRGFINAQPSTTSVGVGYMRNGTVSIAQDFTTDHDQAARALRLPLGSSGSYGNPYLSAIDLMKRWPANNTNRRELVMITDGIDRFAGRQHYRGLGPISPYVDSASSVAQRTGTIIDTIFARGVGRLANNYWEITNGQNSLALLSDQTGGESYYLGTQNPVSFKPYLDDLQKNIDNQYVLEFQANAGKKSGLQYVKLTTEVAGVELDSADSVWVNER